MQRQKKINIIETNLHQDLPNWLKNLMTKPTKQFKYNQLRTNMARNGIGTNKRSIKDRHGQITECSIIFRAKLQFCALTNLVYPRDKIQHLNWQLTK